MINYVFGMMPPARSICNGTQLVYCTEQNHSSTKILNNVITKVSNIITHFTNRLMQCRQNTVVSLMGSIQHCILVMTGRIFNKPAYEKTYSDRIISTEKNARYNHHDNLTHVRKSEKPL